MQTNSRPNIRFNRVYLFVVVIILMWIVLEVRLFDIQINRHDFYVEQSRIQSAKKIKLRAQRGNIYDRTGECMATNIFHYDLGVDLNQVKDRKAIANRFAKVLGRSGDYFRRKMSGKRDFVYLARKVPKDRMPGLEKFDDPGLVVLESSRRFYPFAKCASQIIGFTDVDDRGINGLEMQFEEELSGRDGWTFLLADARRRFGYNVDAPRQMPESGADIFLTINKNFQTIVEEELDRGIKKYNASYGMAVLMDPSSAEILALYSSPGFDPNNPAISTTQQRRNRAIADIFEPGSTFKIFPAAALLQEGIKKPNDIVFCENGKYRYYDHTVNDSKKYAWLSFKKVIENSSNIGMVKLTENLKKRTLYRYLKNFGFDAVTGINLPGEAAGLLSKPNRFSGISKGVISFGQEIGVTAVQIASAYAAVVNGGVLMKPYIVRKITAPGGDILLSNKPKEIRRVISKQVAATLKTFMRDAVKRGTGKKAAIEGVAIGGKTGTAQKYNRKTKRYIRNSYLASFIGFTPIEEPEFVLAVFLDDPNPGYYGGDVAAPVFRSIIKRIINFAPAVDDDQVIQTRMASVKKKMPDFAGLPYAATEDFLAFRDIGYELDGEGSHVFSQSIVDEDLRLVLGNPGIKSKTVPDLRGMTLREAFIRLDFDRFRVTVEGSGKIIKQSIKPGTKVISRQPLHLSCAR